MKTGTGQREMGELRILITQMVSEENHLLDLRQKNVKATLSTTIQIGSAGLVICAVILVLVLLTIYRESTKREEIEVSLQKALNDMEQVSQQTNALSKLSDYMQSCQSTEEAFTVIDNTLPLLLSGASGTVSLFKHSRNMVETVSKWGPDTLESPKDFQPDQCWGLRRGRAHYFVPGGTEPCCTHFAAELTGASLCLPMQAQGETVGLFSLIIDSLEKTSKEKVAFARRVSEQISLAVANLNLQKKLLEQSIRDPLTKLFNRRYLEATLVRELKRAERNKEAVGILVMDIDFFKRFNDTMGHDAGDALLARFAILLEQNVRKEDIVCRYGGEEFVIVLPKANLQQAIDRAEKICEATRKLKINGSEKITAVSVSIGVSEYPMHGTTGPDLITIADSALYRAKHNGRDQVMPATSVQG
jgi:diguanylate cyclase (GGDEF)-like protein